MIRITIPEDSVWNDRTEEFVTVPGITLELEHSLYSMSKWESKYKRPFLDQRQEKSAMEMLDYICMMSINEEVEPKQLRNLRPEDVHKIKDYIDESRTATTLSKEQLGKPSREIVTSELIYCWMVQQNIPFEVQYWHLSRCLMLINVVSLKNQPPKKENPVQAMNRARAFKQAKHASKPHIPRH